MRGRNPRCFMARLADQFQQMMILHMLDPVGKNYKPPIDFIQFAALKLVSQLFAAQAQRVTAGMLARAPGANPAHPPIAAS